MNIEPKRMKSIYNNTYLDKPKEYFIECIKLLPEFDTLIDIGCANGSFLKYVNYIYPKTNLIGIDCNDYNVGDKCYKFISADFIKNQININKSEIITCMGVLSGYNDIDIFLKNLLKLLKKNGTLIIFDNINYIDLDFNIKYRQGGDINNEFSDRYYSYWYSKKTFQKLAEKYNLNVEFIPFEIPFEIPKTDNYGRAYTQNIKNTYKQFVYNDFPLNFHFIKYTFKS